VNYVNVNVNISSSRATSYATGKLLALAILHIAHAALRNIRSLEARKGARPLRCHMKLAVKLAVINAVKALLKSILNLICFKTVCL
jgi:hypothetical protein